MSHVLERYYDAPEAEALLLQEPIFISLDGSWIASRVCVPQLDVDHTIATLTFHAYVQVEDRFTSIFADKRMLPETLRTYQNGPFIPQLPEDTQ